MSSFLIASAITHPSSIHAQQTTSTDVPLATTSTLTTDATSPPPIDQPHFNFVGKGFCLDSSLEYYSGTRCMRSPDNLVGFSHDFFSGACYCEYDAGQLPNPIPLGPRLPVWLF
eukprot:scaffold49979_cov23-Cyclotella_meneghiniana.AAC.1